MIEHLNAALEGCYRIERELGEGGVRGIYRRSFPEPGTKRSTRRPPDNRELL